MRLFIGIDIPVEVKNNLYGIQKFISPKIAKIKWVEKKKLHITLKFLGNVDKTKLSEIKKRLNSINFNKFDLKFREIGLFSKNNKSYIIKLSFFESKELSKLQMQIDESLIDLFSKPQKFTLHLTLGRIKLIKKEKEFYNRLKEFNLIKDKFEINKFKLIQSVPLKGRHIYKTLYEFKP